MTSPELRQPRSDPDNRNYQGSLRTPEESPEGGLEPIVECTRD